MPGEDTVTSLRIFTDQQKDDVRTLCDMHGQATVTGYSTARARWASHSTTGDCSQPSGIPSAKCSLQSSGDCSQSPKP